MTRSHLSIGIVGGGPAGCATALALQKQFASSSEKAEITLITAPDSGTPKIGETVPPAASSYLRELDLESLLSEEFHLRCPGSLSQWGDESVGYNDFFITPIGQGFHLDRTLFDKNLLSACFKRGVTVVENTKVTAIKQSDRTISLNCEPELDKHEFDFIVDASGQHRVVTRSLSVANNLFDRVVSVCAFVELESNSSAPAHTIVSSDEYGWWYAARLPNNRAILSFNTDADELKQRRLNSNEKWYHAFCNNQWFYTQCCEQFNQAIPSPRVLFVRTAPSSILSAVIGDNWLAVGDAASSYDSISSAGITKSLKQGIRAAKAILNWVDNPNKASLSAYQALVFQDFNEFIKLHQLHYDSGAHRFPNSAFWQRRLLNEI
ncbi:tryptophan 7-halogenase (plasmid) [Pseudoalteromonas xiamenensis]|uniref:NAD(P)/FAD-dependent oxidoreductase n=1 Tax=Pseudoalteromonas xiamenensis TaxID=882626 RepID=UPI0027E501A7|nr:tryptophan 7-halogenase [Pseudoalteromonas xiamenensis]WMN61743.1 tryptophan 7-halogenase [Pseudoalteromonas xiamenensis]